MDPLYLGEGLKKFLWIGDGKSNNELAFVGFKNIYIYMCVAVL